MSPTGLGEGELEVVEISWSATPFRADRFEEAWRPAVELSLEYGARWYTFLRATDDRWGFKQLMAFADRLDFERYWYSEEIAEARSAVAGLHDVPVLPTWFRPVTHGSTRREPVEG